MNAKRIFLGSVQFGLDYGISNTAGSPSDQELHEIIDLAESSGIRGIDTAQAYGSAEPRLGKEEMQAFELVGKIAPNTPTADIRNSCLNSLKALGIPKFHGLLLHRFEDVLEDETRWNEIQQLKQEGLVQKTGFSIYSPEQLDVIESKAWSFDIVQLPFNIYDKRFASRLSSLKAQGVQVHARSVFLQGLLFLSPEKLNAHFKSIVAHHQKLHTEIAEKNSTVLELALSEVFKETQIDCIVLGVNSASELKEILDVVSMMDSEQVPTLKDDYRLDDESILLPQNWSW